MVADRHDQRRLLLITQASMACARARPRPLDGHRRGDLWEVYVFAFAFGCAAAFDAPVRQAFVGQLVEREGPGQCRGAQFDHLQRRANDRPGSRGYSQSPRSEPAGPFWSMALSFVAVLASLLMLRQGDLHPQRSGRAQARRIRRRLPLCLEPGGPAHDLMMLFLIGTFGMNFAIWTSAMAVKVFHTDAHGYGILSSMMAVGHDRRGADGRGSRAAVLLAPADRHRGVRHRLRVRRNWRRDTGGSAPRWR